MENKCWDCLNKNNENWSIWKVFSTEQWLSTHIEREQKLTESKSKVIVNNKRRKNTFPEKNLYFTASIKDW